MPDRMAAAHLDQGPGPRLSCPMASCQGRGAQHGGVSRRERGDLRVPGWAGDGRVEVGTESCYSWRPGNLGLK